MSAKQIGQRFASVESRNLNPVEDYMANIAVSMDEYIQRLYRESGAEGLALAGFVNVARLIGPADAA